MSHAREKCSRVLLCSESMTRTGHAVLPGQAKFGIFVLHGRNFDEYNVVTHLLMRRKKQKEKCNERRIYVYAFVQLWY